MEANFDFVFRSLRWGSLSCCQQLLLKNFLPAPKILPSQEESLLSPRETRCKRARRIAAEDVMATEIDVTPAWPRPPGRKRPALVIANRHEIAGAGIEALLQAGGHSVVARCSDEHDLLRCAKAYRPDIILLAQNIVQEAAKTILRLRARNFSVAIIFLLEERDAITVAGLLDLDVEGILLDAAGARSVIDCVESVRHGRKWVDPNLLRHLAQPSQIASSLTSRESEIALLISRSLRNKEIARVLHLSEGTVKMHLHHIYQKLHLVGRTQLALSTARACAQMAVPGNELRPPEETARPDSAERQLSPSGARARGSSARRAAIRRLMSSLVIVLADPRVQIGLLLNN
jgi:two-component system nitrate/nitrite response regulator NarL